MFEKMHATLTQIKRKKPLILNITNYVTMDFVANGLLSLGASPVMSQAEEEIEDLVQQAHSVVINLGTLNEKFIALCKSTCQIANRFNKPIVLDPVGAGASHYRTDTSRSLLSEFSIAIVRGNAGEVMALSGAMHTTYGVDSNENSINVLKSAKKLSKKYNNIVVVSGKTDWIVNKEITAQLDRGSHLMPSITGTGCLHTAVIAAFHAVLADRFTAAKMATLFYGACAENAENNANAPGTFRTQFLNSLYRMPEQSHYESS